MLRSLEQKRAKYAWDSISNVKSMDTKIQEKYSSYVKKVPAQIVTNGLGNTLAFLKSKSSGEEAYRLLNNHITNWFKEIRGENKDLLGWIISEDTSSIEVFRETKEILALLNWMKRFAEAELKGGKSAE